MSTSQPTAAASVDTQETVPAAQTVQPGKFDGMQKTVGSKAKGVLNFIHNTGEQVRGNINAALDGAGDAIAGRKTGDVESRAGNPATSAAVPEAATSAPAVEEVHTETAPAPTETQEKRYPIGQFFNTSLKRTATLVHRVTSSLRSNASQKANSLGNTLAQGKQRASKRFSKAPKPTAEATAEVVEAPAANAPGETVVA